MCFVWCRRQHAVFRRVVSSRQAASLRPPPSPSRITVCWCCAHHWVKWLTILPCRHACVRRCSVHSSVNVASATRVDIHTSHDHVLTRTTTTAMFTQPDTHTHTLQLSSGPRHHDCGCDGGGAAPPYFFSQSVPSSAVSAFSMSWNRARACTASATSGYNNRDHNHTR